MTDTEKDSRAQTASENRFADTFLAEARDIVPLPGDDLMQRILADAAAVMPVAARTARAAPSSPVRTGWRGTLAAIGGWPALGGMALATMAGLWIGVAPPASLTTLASGVWGETVSVQLYTDDDPFGLLEG